MRRREIALNQGIMRVRCNYLCVDFGYIFIYTIKPAHFIMIMLLKHAGVQEKGDIIVSCIHRSMVLRLGLGHSWGM